ncbi:MAG: leucine-rich repeat domain-containing protein [Alistipes sp.]|nr:leucine-rich repeat domain-containing protein [Alistipes sp.]
MRKIFTLFVAVFVLITSCTEKNDDHIINSADCSLNEIIYTTKYDYPIELNVTNGFGGNFVSHTYEDGIGKIVFDNDVICIPARAFYNCDTIESIIMPSNVRDIQKGAFLNCSSLKTLVIGNEIKTVAYDAFNGCTQLKEFNCKLASKDKRCLIIDGELEAILLTDYNEHAYTIPNNVTKIGNQIFRDCEYEFDLNIPDGVSIIGDNAFYNAKFSNISIGKDIKEVGENAFRGCAGEVFINCNIGNKWFKESNFTHISVADNVTQIGDSAFYSCDGLASVIIGDGVTTIGGSTFCGCNSLTSVYFKATTPPTLGDSYVFTFNADGRRLYVPVESVEAYKAAENWSYYAADIVGHDGV